ncbi:MAG TPA: TrkA C-terminal domain-containing protein [Eubacteriales bacterium]|nr:TrkA C-terminal domain-containing protein [Eubacteriales bacterium]
MNSLELSPQYLRIALDIAERIVKGDLRAGQRLSGRSLFASEYGVSPETIRRALKLLADMKVVDIKDKSGVYILSVDNAGRYLKNFDGWNEQIALRKKLKQLLQAQNDLNRQIVELYSEIIKSQDTASAAVKSLPNYEVRVPADSPCIGKSIGTLRFWQSTGATIIAIKRAHGVIASPGPYAELYGGDVIVFVGDASTVSSVERFLSGAPAENAQQTKAQEESDDSI